MTQQRSHPSPDIFHQVIRRLLDKLELTHSRVDHAELMAQHKQRGLHIEGCAARAMALAARGIFKRPV